MNDFEEPKNIISYKFHHIDIDKCKTCTEFSCENACFRGIYEVLNKDGIPECTVIKDKEDRCVKCHICTTMCKKRAILID